LFAGINLAPGSRVHAIFSSKGQTLTLDETDSSFKSEILLVPLFIHHLKLNKGDDITLAALYLEPPSNE
jgi:hypothetical protein